jgi:hypothetical protein
VFHFNATMMSLSKLQAWAEVDGGMAQATQAGLTPLAGTGAASRQLPF